MSEIFRAVEWMRERRKRIDDEDAGLIWAEKSRKTEASLAGDAVWQRLACRVTKPRAATSAVADRR